MKHASLTRRSIAHVLDDVLAIATFCLGYYILLLFTARWSTSPGKRLLGLVIYDATSRQPASAHRVWLREGFFKVGLPLILAVATGFVTNQETAEGVIVVYLLAGVLSPFVTTDRKSMWDYMANTTIGYTPEGRRAPSKASGSVGDDGFKRFEDALPSRGSPNGDDFKRFEDSLPSRRSPIR